MYIWQHTHWPNFSWDETRLRPLLDSTRLLQGKLLGLADAAPAVSSLDAQIDALIQNAIRTSEIEGEHLDYGSVRSSVARQLGVERAGFNGPTTPESESLVRLLLESCNETAHPISVSTLLNWQALLFPRGGGILSPVRVGQLRGNEPMQVVSGRLDKPRVHFEAPPRQKLEPMLDAFLHWFNHPPAQLDPLLRAGIAHLWLITLHPFDDGNGRVTRAVTDRALAQAESQSVRFYCLSEAIMANRHRYYEQLERAQKGSLDITGWLQWYLQTLEDAMNQAVIRLHRVLHKTRFWQTHAETPLNERQRKVLNRLLNSQGQDFLQGINAQKYRALTGVSKATATRDIAELLEKGCLEKLPGGGRSTRYRLKMLDNMGDVIEQKGVT